MVGGGKKADGKELKDDRSSESIHIVFYCRIREPFLAVVFVAVLWV